MKRMLVLFVVALVLVSGVSAQDLSGLGRDFEVVIEELGAATLPALTQSAIWGQYTGSASFVDGSRFFLTLSLGTIFTDGVLGFVDDEEAFTVLNVPGLFRTILDAAAVDALTDASEGMKTFFPVPVSRVSAGVKLPGDLEAMVGFGGVPAFVTAPILGGLNADGLELGMVHLGTKVRRAVLKDAGPFPAISVGAGYSYSGFRFAYDLAQLGTGRGDYGGLSVELGELYLKGVMSADSRVHAFGLDVHASKAFGFFVPYVGISPYYHIASFSGGVGSPGNEFDAYVDYDDDGDRDVEYTGRAPSTAVVRDDLSIVVFGGFDMVFGRVVLQVNGSWGIGTGYPGVALNVRWQ